MLQEFQFESRTNFQPQLIRTPWRSTTSAANATRSPGQEIDEDFENMSDDVRDLEQVLSQDLDRSFSSDAGKMYNCLLGTTFWSPFRLRCRAITLFRGHRVLLHVSRILGLLPEEFFHRPVRGYASSRREGSRLGVITGGNISGGSAHTFRTGPCANVSPYVTKQFDIISPYIYCLWPGACPVHGRPSSRHEGPREGVILEGDMCAWSAHPPGFNLPARTYTPQGSGPQ